MTGERGLSEGCRTALSKGCRAAEFSPEGSMCVPLLAVCCVCVCVCVCVLLTEFVRCGAVESRNRKELVCLVGKWGC